MKTTEQWLELQAPLLARQRAFYGAEHHQRWVDDIKAIQLDAIKEGMRRAADLACGYASAERANLHIGAILTAAEQLTEKDLSI